MILPFMKEIKSGRGCERLMLSLPNCANITHTHTHTHTLTHQLFIKTMSICGNEIMGLTQLPSLGSRKQVCFEMVKETVRLGKVGMLISHLCLSRSRITCIHR